MPDRFQTVYDKDGRKVFLYPPPDDECRMRCAVCGVDATDHYATNGLGCRLCCPCYDRIYARPPSWAGWTVISVAMVIGFAIGFWIGADFG